MSRALAIEQGFAGCRHGALTVIEHPASRDEINRQLGQLNPGLFIERQLSAATEEAVWTVCLDAGEQGIIGLFEWREYADGDADGAPSGPPIAYPSARIVDEFQRRYQRGPVTVEQIRRQNEEKKRRDRAELSEEFEQLVHDHYRLAKPTHASLFHRGLGLRRARDRMRARGHKV